MTATTTQKDTATDNDRELRKAALAAARGSLAWVNYTADDYLREKREDVARENED